MGKNLLKRNGEMFYLQREFAKPTCFHHEWEHVNQTPIHDGYMLACNEHVVSCLALKVVSIEVPKAKSYGS